MICRLYVSHLLSHLFMDRFDCLSMRHDHTPLYPYVGTRDDQVDVFYIRRDMTVIMHGKASL